MKKSGDGDTPQNGESKEEGIMMTAVTGVTALSGEIENDKEKEDKYSNEDNSRKNSFNDYMKEKNEDKDKEDGKEVKKVNE